MISVSIGEYSAGTGLNHKLHRFQHGYPGFEMRGLSHCQVSFIANTNRNKLVLNQHKNISSAGQPSFQDGQIFTVSSNVHVIPQ